MPFLNPGPEEDDCVACEDCGAAELAAELAGAGAADELGSAAAFWAIGVELAGGGVLEVVGFTEVVVMGSGVFVEMTDVAKVAKVVVTAGEVVVVGAVVLDAGVLEAVGVISPLYVVVVRTGLPFSST